MGYRDRPEWIKARRDYLTETKPEEAPSDSLARKVLAICTMYRIETQDTAPKVYLARVLDKTQHGAKAEVIDVAADPETAKAAANAYAEKQGVRESPNWWIVPAGHREWEPRGEHLVFQVEEWEVQGG